MRCGVSRKACWPSNLTSSLWRSAIILNLSQVLRETVSALGVAKPFHYYSNKSTAPDKIVVHRPRVCQSLDSPDSVRVLIPIIRAEVLNSSGELIKHLVGDVPFLDAESCIALPRWANKSEGLPGLFRGLPSVLRNRTLVFVGDSSSDELASDLAWAVTVYRGGERPRRHHHHGAMCCSWDSTGFSVCSIVAGREGGILRLPQHADGRPECSKLADFDDDLSGLQLKDVVACLHHIFPTGRSHRNVVVVNEGGASQQDGSWNYIPNRLRYESLIQGLLSWYYKTELIRRPILIWREALPEHYATDAGGWDRSQGEACLSTEDGGGGGGCQPLARLHVASQQMANDLALPVIAKTTVPVVRAFEAAKEFWDMHPGCASGTAAPDCTGWLVPSPVLRRVNLMVLSALGQKLGRAKEPPSAPSRRPFSVTALPELAVNAQPGLKLS